MFNRRGFSLIQLIVVMAVLAILVGLAVPKLMGHTQEAQLTRLLYDARLLEDACHRYYIDNQDWPRGEGPLDESDLTDVAYTIKGEETTLDPSSANYYRLDMVALNDYVRINTDPLNYVLQNPVGSVYTLDPETNPALVGQDRQVEVSSWTQTFGGSSNDCAWSVQQTTDGGYIIAGSTYSYGAGSDDVYLIKTDAQGNQEWYKTFGGSSYDGAFSVQQTTDGGYIIAGRTFSPNGGYFCEVNLIKTDIQGNQEWHKTWYELYKHSCCAYSVQQTSDGGYIIAGETLSDDGDNDIYLIKTDIQGNKKWAEVFGGSSNDGALSVQQTTDGGYIIAGYTYSYGAGGNDVYLIKTDAQGNQKWYKTFGGSSGDYAYSVQQTTDGGYIIAGYTTSYGTGSSDVYLVKTDSQGSQEWYKTFGGNDYDYAYSVQQTTDGGYIMAGYTNSYGAGNYDVYLIKTDSQGNLEWYKIFGGSGHDQARSVQQTSDGGYIVAGYTNSYGAGGSDVYLIKTDTQGNVK